MSYSIAPTRAQFFTSRYTPFQESDEVGRSSVGGIIGRTSRGATGEMDFAGSVTRVCALEDKEKSEGSAGARERYRARRGKESKSKQDKLTMMQTSIFAFRNVPCHLVAITG